MSEPSPAAQTFVAPPVPSWVEGDPQKQSKEDRRKAGKRNADIVKKANKSRTRYDFVLYGDSITQVVGDKYMDIWNKYFGGMKSAPLGISGDTVEELSWRLVYGKERFAVDPKVAAFLIGINNIKGARNDPAEKMEFLMPWIRAAWPTSRLILVGILPNAFVSVKEANKKYEKLSKKYGFEYTSCGSQMNPKDKKLFGDGTHPAPDGYHVLYSCLRDLVRK
jgi:lysophospholipase L1-like esterase